MHEMLSQSSSQFCIRMRLDRCVDSELGEQNGCRCDDAAASRHPGRKEHGGMMRVTIHRLRYEQGGATPASCVACTTCTACKEDSVFQGMKVR